MKKIFLTLACLTAAMVGAVAAWNATRSYPESAVRLPIADYLPTGEAEGWTYEDLPLGHTESLDAKAHELLNLTDFVYRRYTYVGGGSADRSSFVVPRSAADAVSGSSFLVPRSEQNGLALDTEERRTKNQERRTRPQVGDTFEIYIAYWAPGTMPARMMNTHTPDTCWVASGWQIRERDDAYLLGGQASVGSSSVVPRSSLNDNEERRTKNEEHIMAPAFDFLSQLPIPDLAAIPGRWRIFEKHQTDLPVVFWHLLEGEVYQYGNQSLGKRLKRLILDPFKNGFDTRKEQWLVRVSG